MPVRMARWLIFGVLAGSIPLAYDIYHGFVHSYSYTVAYVLGGGGMLLVAASLSSLGIGSAIATHYAGQLEQVLVIGGAVLVLFASAMAYGDVSSSVEVNQDVNHSFIMWSSVAIYIMALIVSGWCVYISGDD